MSIERYEITEAIGRIPIISRAVTHNGIVYLCGVTPDPVGDVTTQTRQVLDRIDALLVKAGTNKSKLITTQVWLARMSDFAAHNAVWNEWVDSESAGASLCPVSRAVAARHAGGDHGHSSQVVQERWRSRLRHRSNSRSQEKNFQPAGLPSCWFDQWPRL
jgi:enamine deaminase RidA (YjgF/YER057c/UK114 family)